ncbi:MAG: glycosyltransferase family 4 protein [bacterium]|jgi:phosphatidyl-myo-inositol dimannoside synthase|nr:glycosyltransferase family 4 protein [bacterium]
MSEKKILLITPDFPPMTGGVARYLKELCTYLKDDIEVLTKPHPQWQSFDPTAGCAVYRQPLLHKWRWPKWMKAVKYLREYKDRYRLIITSHVLPFGSACLMAKKKTGTPYVVILHGMDVRLAQKSAKKKRLATQVLKEARLVVVNSKALAQEVAKVFGITQSLVVYPCVSPVEEQECKDDGVFRLLTVSRLVERKGHQHVLNVLARLRGMGRMNRFQYDIVGAGPMDQTLKSMVTNLGLDAHVTFHGQVDDQTKNQFYAAADTFVMPVEYDPIDKEGFGLVFIEAAQYGLPSITSDIAGVNEAVRNGETGILLPDLDEENLAGAILQLYTDVEYRKQLGEAAKTYAENFSCEKQLSKLKPYLI